MKLLPEKVIVELSDPRKKDEKFALTMDLYDLPITHRWLKALKTNLDQNLFLEKTFCFVGFIKSHRNVEFLCNELNKNIKAINEHWAGKYNIDLHFTPEKVQGTNGLNQTMMNELHHHFAILNGQVWNMSEFYKESPFHIQLSIRRLNHLCHELETFADQLRVARQWGAEVLHPAIICSFSQAERIPLEEEDYNHFKYEHSFGRVYLHYCQVGKRWDEAFDDRDNVASSEEISGLRYFSGEFNVNFGISEPMNYEGKLKEIKEWIRSQGKDPEDKKLSLGWIHFAEFNRQKNFGEMGTLEIHEHLAKFSDIHKISIIDGKGETLAVSTWPISFLDEEFDEHYLKAIKKAYGVN